MKHNLTIFLACLSLFAACKSEKPRAIAQDPVIEAKIKEHLSRMTVEEKVGQLIQLTAGVVLEPGTDHLSAQGEQILRKYKIGSVLNTMDDKASTPERYRNFIGQIQDVCIDETGIPCLYGLDQIHGASYTSGAVLFPQEIALAASFNEQLAYDMGRITAYETRACNVPWVFSPTLDLSRNQCWPRMWESYGEDPLVQSRMGVQHTLGLQGSDPNHLDSEHVAACIKHYMAYGAAVSGQDRTPSMVSKRELKEKYFPAFKACIEAGALSLMVNSSNNDGIPFHTNKELLTGWAKEELGWDGLIVTDWADIANVFDRDHTAADYKEALCQSINAGVDLIMEPYNPGIFDLLMELVQEKKIPMSRLNDAVARNLRIKYRLGLFDDPYSQGTYSEFASEEHIQCAYRAALESEVLLKNEDGLLPLSKDCHIILVGPNANSMRTLGGGWNYTWQGDGANLEEYTGQYNTIYEALKNKFAHVDYLPVLEYSNRPFAFEEEIVGDYNKALRAARKADVIVLALGENTYCETPGNINDLNLSANQKELVRVLSQSGKPMVMVLNEGRPRVIREIEPLAQAIVHVLLPGNYGGDALAALLCGEENFSAKMPYTYPMYVNRLNTYDYKLCENRATMDGLYNYDAKIASQWSFGYGLSYTTFEYSNLKVDKSVFAPGDVIKVSVDVENTGSVAGKEPVLLFVSDLVASLTPDVRRLRDFTKVSLVPGEKKTVTFNLKANDLAFIDHDLKPVLEDGDFRLAVGPLSTTITCSR